MLQITDLPWLPVAPKDWEELLKQKPIPGEDVGQHFRQLANYRLTPNQTRRLMRSFKETVRKDTINETSSLSSFRLSVLTSYTFDIVADSLLVAGLRHGLEIDFDIAPFGQVVQEALDPNSHTNRSAFDAALLAIDHRWLGLDQMVQASEAQSVVNEAIDKIKVVVDGLFKTSGTPIIITTIPNSTSQMFGSFDRQFTGSVRRMIDETNRQIVELSEYSNCYLFDLASLAETIGLERWHNVAQWNAYKLPFDAEFGSIYSEWLCRILGAIRGKSYKCLVLDLDNTLWGGAIGDDGVEGIVLGEGSGRGEAHLAVQKYALALKNRGILLAVASKNDLETALSAFRTHPEMVLQEEDISAFEANWLDKSGNLEVIANVLNIGLDSLVFLDDNPAERSQVRNRLPMVAVPEIPNDPTEYQQLLNAAGYFEAVSFSDEDRLRVAAIQADGSRDKIKRASVSVGDYLISLEMELHISHFDKAGRKRITQLINKTNQFNLTTKRYSEAQVEAFEDDPAVYTLQARLRDKFGDLGMISVVICKELPHQANVWEIDTWLMSCRVLGRNVESALLYKIVDDAKKRGVQKLLGRYVPTAKNSMVTQHFKTLGFELIEGKPDGSSLWELDIKSFDGLESNYFLYRHNSDQVNP